MEAQQETLDFEKRLAAARAILEKLGQPDLPLEQGVTLYKEGMAMLDEAAKILEQAELTFQAIEGIQEPTDNA